MVRQLQAGLREQRLVRVRLTTYGSSGLPFVAEFTVTPLTDEMGNVSHLVGTLKRRSEMMSSQHVAGTSSSLADRAVAAALLAHPSMARPASSAAPAASHMGMDPLATQSGEGMQEEDRQPKLPQPSGSSQDPLLSRDFTLYTLNNHPIAPVLLRMLQVNTSAAQKSAMCDNEGKIGSSHDSAMDTSDSVVVESGADGQGSSSFSAGGSSCRPRSLDLSQEFLEAVNAQGVLPQQSWPQQAARYHGSSMDGNKQQAGTAQCPLSPTLTPTSPRALTAEQHPAKTFRTCGRCGVCSSCRGISTTQGLVGDTVDALMNESTRMLPWVRGQRKRGCDMGQGYAPAAALRPQQTVLQAQQMQHVHTQQQAQSQHPAWQMQQQGHAGHSQVHAAQACAVHQPAHCAAKVQQQSAQLQQPQQLLQQTQQSQPRAATLQPHSTEVKQLLNKETSEQRALQSCCRQESQTRQGDTGAAPVELDSRALPMKGGLCGQARSSMPLEARSRSQEPCAESSASASQEASTSLAADCSPSSVTGGSQSPDSEVLAIDDVLDVLDSFWSDASDATKHEMSTEAAPDMSGS